MTWMGGCAVPALVEAVQGGGPALQCGGRATDLRWIADRSGRLATVLAGVGVGPGTVVGLCLDRSALLPTGLLGVWSAGAAYVPMDPALPVRRLRHMLEAAGLRVVVTQRSTSDLVTERVRAGVRVVCLDDAEVDEATPLAVPVAVRGDDLAYVMYTSGSSGTPKAVAVPHAGVAALLEWACAEWALGPGDTLVAMGTISFDISVPELLVPLLRGARLVVATREQVADVLKLRQLLIGCAATALFTTPTVWRLLVDAGGVPQCVRTRLVGGEPLHRGLADDLLEPGVRLWNLYGLTETSVCSTAGRVDRSAATVGLGSPLPGTSVHLLDTALAPVAEGEVGELYVGGVGVSRGYLGDVRLTADRYLPDPYSADPGARMYRTGDLARRDAAGQLVFQGRGDGQVKVHGVRVETGEVEAAFDRCAEVAACVVTAVERGPQTHLVAHVVPRERDVPHDQLAARLRAALSEVLPAQSVPRDVVIVAGLPLTASGKVDRDALPFPEVSPAAYVGAASAGVVAEGAAEGPPPDATEWRVAQLCAEVLGRPTIDPKRSFHEAGGDSLSAMRLQWRIGTDLGVEVPLRSLLEAPSLVDLARMLDHTRAGAAQRDAEGRSAEISPVPAGQELPLSYAQESLWFLHRLSPHSPFYTVSVNLHLRGALDLDALGSALSLLVARHETLRTWYEQLDDRVRQIVDPPVPVDVAPVDVPGATDTERWERAHRLAVEELQRPFDLTRDPMFRCRLLRLGPDEHVLLMGMHHIALDGWSVDVLLRDLAAAYAGRTLPVLPVRYADYAAWQRVRWGTAELEQQRRYWRRQLAGPPEPLRLPADLPRPPVQTFAGAERQFEVPPDVTAGLRRLARAGNDSMFTVVLAAFTALLSQLSGREDVCVGVPVAGRGRTEVADVVGMFVNTVVLRGDLSGDPTAADLVYRLRHTKHEADENQDVPFERVVEDLAPPRDLSRNPLFQVLFWLLPHRAHQPADWGGLEVTGFEPMQSTPFGMGASTATVRCDLEFVVREVDDRLSCYLVHNTDVYTPEGVDRMIEHLQKVLRAFAARPGGRLSQLPPWPGRTGLEQSAEEQDGTRLSAGTDPRAPSSAAPVSGAAGQDTARMLIDLWSEVLRRPQIGLDDDFFASGGHSLSALQLVWRLQKRLGTEVPVQLLFEAPTPRRLARRIEAGFAPSAGIVPVGRDGRLPLSFAQQRLWFLDRLVPGDSSYTLVWVGRFTGRTDVSALERAVSVVVRRHEPLRTRFGVVQGEPYQLIDPPAPVTLPVVNLLGEPDDVRSQALWDILTRETDRVFDLAAGPVFRATLVRTAPEEHLFVWSMHHVAADGWSIGRLRTEVAEVYRAEVTGTPAALPPLPVGYADFAVWQRSCLRGEAVTRSIEYWTHELAGAAQLELPTDRPRAPLQNAGAEHEFELAPDVVDAVRRLSRELRATPFTTLLAAFQVLLGRYSGQTDFTVGSPQTDRPRAETAPLIGLFLNAVVHRARLTGDPTFLELVERVRQSAAAAKAHQHLPFEMLVDALSPDRDLTRTPLFQVDFQITPRPPSEGVRLPGVVLTDGPQPRVRTAVLDLSMYLTDRDGAIGGSIRYRTDLFDAGTIERLAANYECLLRGLLTAPQVPVARIPLVAPAQRHWLVQEWNDTALPFPAQRTLAELFEDQADRTPDAPAVAFEGTRLTYRELDRRADRLARLLRRRGARPEVLVALCLERGADLVVAVLATWKAGAGYLPLDPDHPTERIATLLSDAGARLVVTQESLLGRLPADQAAAAVCLDRDGAVLATEPDGRLAPSATATSLAYVIYTSGSTGRPKGVMIEHRGLCNFAQELKWIPRGRPGRVTLNAPLAFDQSLDTMLALCHGWEIVVVPEDVRWAPSQFLRWLRKTRPDVLECTPTQLRPLLQAGFAEQDGLCSELLVSGEPIDASLWRELWALDGVRAWNSYGPTECTIDTTVACVADTRDPVIGRPVHNAQVYLLDAELDCVPAGVTGEIYIGGAGLARGYLGRADLTAERFVPDPFSGRPGDRLYRTGDLGRLGSDGALRFLGRTDDQVKIRGYRVETTEVEAVVSAYPGVLAAVVIASDTDGVDRRLVAYVVPVPGTDAPDVASLRDHVLRQLPQYMVPSVFVMIPRIPRTPNGKLDRQALPAPTKRPQLSVGYVAPRPGSEATVAAVWAEVLGLERIGAADDFFELGGNSLSLMRVLWRLEEEFDAQVPIEQFFATPTVAALALLVGAAGAQLP